MSCVSRDVVTLSSINHVSIKMTVKHVMLPVGGFNHFPVQVRAGDNDNNIIFDDYEHGVFRVFCEWKRAMEHPVFVAPHRYQEHDLDEGEVTCLACLALR